MNIIIPFNIKFTIFDEDKPLTQKQIKIRNNLIDMNNIDNDIKRNKCALVRRLKIISHKKPRHEAQKHGIGYRQERYAEFEPFIC